MTFTHLEDETTQKLEKSIELYGEILMNCLLEAVDCERLTCGVSECAKILKCYPENVMFCILPEAGSKNISVHIQHTLIEAFCWENDIKILKVKTNSIGKKSDIKNRGSSIPSDTSFMLIEYPKEHLSSADDQMVDFYDTMIMSDVYPKPVIELPI